MNKLQEQYLVSIADGNKSEIIYTLVPSNKEFSYLLDMLNPDTQIILTVTPLGNVINFKELMIRLTKSNKPKDLNFGEENGQ